MSELIKQLEGRTVTVYTAAGETEHKDTGVVHSADSTIVVLESPSGLLVFPLARVRLIKVLK